MRKLPVFVALAALGSSACDNPNRARAQSIQLDPTHNLLHHETKMSVQNELGRSLSVDLRHHGIPTPASTQDNYWLKVGGDHELVVVDARGTRSEHPGPLIARFYYVGATLVVIEGDEKNPLRQSLYHQPVSWKSQKL